MNREITEYAVFGASDIEKFEVKIQECIQKGWQPIGGVAMSFQGDKGLFIQSMVKHKKENANNIAVNNVSDLLP